MKRERLYKQYSLFFLNEQRVTMYRRIFCICGEICLCYVVLNPTFISFGCATGCSPGKWFALCESESQRGFSSFGGPSLVPPSPPSTACTPVQQMPALQQARARRQNRIPHPALQCSLPPLQQWHHRHQNAAARPRGRHRGLRFSPCCCRCLQAPRGLGWARETPMSSRWHWW